MKSVTVIASLITLLSSTSYAATVTLQETPCLQNNTQLETFTIETDKLVEKELKSVCGLKITSASGVDVNSISCLAYKDKEGQDVGSARFTFAEPALISTNPVQEGSIRCDGNVNGTTSTLITTVTPTGTAPGSEGTHVPTSVGSGSGGNSTVNIPTTPTATTEPGATTGASGATGTGVPENEGAAGQVTVSLALIVAAAFAPIII